eukprot:gene6897-12506_t
MAKEDKETEEPIFHRGQPLQGESVKEESQWSERCYGLWLRDEKEYGGTAEPVCLGINIVHITKRVLNSKITPSSTRGVQIIIEEMANEEKTQMFKTDENIGEDGMIAYRAPKIKRPKKDETTKQPTLSDNIMENFKAKAANINKRYEKYTNDPAAVTEIWYEFKDGAYHHYETGKRLLSYVKPSEKWLQMNTFCKQHFEDAVNWFNEKSGK